eukprot:gene10043-11114_t
MDEKDFVAEIEYVLGSYEGYSKYQRLLGMVKKGKGLAPLALRALLSSLRSSELTEFYRKHVKCLEADFPSIFQEEEEDHLKDWLAESEATLRDQQALAENELRAATSSLIKESIRLAMVDLASIYQRWGKLEEATKELLRSREHCSTPGQHSSLQTTLLTLSVQLGHYLNTTNFVKKALDVSSEPSVTLKAKIASALVSLHHEDIRAAAHSLLSIHEDAGSSNNDLLSAREIGLYSLICAVASFDRRALRRELLDQRPFVARFLLPDPRLRVMVSSLSSGQYAVFLHELRLLLPRMQVDFHLAERAERLVDLCSQQLLRHYLAPYCMVTFDRACQDLSLSEEDMIRMVVSLNQSLSTLKATDDQSSSPSQLNFRIDSANRTLVRAKAESSQDRVLAVEALLQQHLLVAKGCLLRFSVLDQGLFASEKREEHGRLIGGSEQSVRVDNCYDREDPADQQSVSGRTRQVAAPSSVVSSTSASAVLAAAATFAIPPQPEVSTQAVEGMESGEGEDDSEEEDEDVMHDD